MIISPKYDYFMKEMFHNSVVLRYFIGDVLKIPQEQILNIRLRDTFLRKRLKKQKLGILDVVVELNDDIKINIELRVKVFEYWDRRQLFYLSKLYTEDIVSGENYSCLKKTIGISILNFNLSEHNSYHTIYRLRDKGGHEFSDQLEIHVIELNKELTGQGEIDDWIRFFNVKTEEDIEMIKTNNPGIREAIRELRRMSLNNPLRVLHEAHLKQIRDEKARESYVRKQGIAEGIAEGKAEGIAEGKAEAIIYLLEMKGPVGEELQTQIRSEKNIAQLDQWVRLAAQSRSVEEFQNKK